MSSPAPAPDAAAPARAEPAAPPPGKKRGFVRRWLRRLLKWGLIGAALGVFLGVALVVWILWFFPNDLVAGIAEEQAAGLGFALKIGDLDVRPLEGVTVSGLTLDAGANEALGAPPLVSVAKMDVRWSLRSAWKDRRVHVQSIEIEEPELVLHQTEGVWNVQRVLDTLMPPAVAPGPTPEPTPAPGPAPPLEEQIAAHVAVLDSALALLPVPVDLDRLHVAGAGARVITDAGTIARVDGLSANVALHLTSSGGTVEVALEPEPGITLALQPGGALGFSGTLKPKTLLTLDLAETVTFGADIALADAVAVAPAIGELPLDAAVKGYGMIEVPEGNVTLVAESVDVGGFLDAAASFEAEALGTRALRARWSSGIHGKKLPGFVTDGVVQAISATSLNLGLSVKGSMEGRLTTAEPAGIAAILAKGQLPLTLSIESEGVTAEDLIAIDGVALGKLAHRARVDVAPERVTVDGAVDLTRVRVDALLRGKPFDVALQNRLEIAADLDGLAVQKAGVRIPATGLHVDGKGSLRGLRAALAAFTAASARNPDDVVAAALAALTAMREIDLGGTVELSAPKEIELVEGGFLKGRMIAKGSLTRKADPYGRLRADVRYVDFGARIAGTPPVPPKAKAGQTPAPEPAASPTPLPDALLVEGLNAHLVMDRELILGGAIPKAEPGADVETDEAIVFDPATRGYYDRLGSLRAESDNFRIARVLLPPLKISDLSAEVLYDQHAIHVNRGRMQVLGGEVVGRAILRPTAEGLHVALAGDVSGVDMSPLLLERPVGNPNDTRVHMSSAMSFFLSKEDPIGSLADMRMRLDVTAAGSKVLDTLLAWLDPEFKDPMFNWARSVNKKVVGLTRPQFSAVADHGMYDVTVGFPSLGLEKEVKRIPLKPLLNLRFTQDMVGGFAPPGELLPLLAARGIDGDGKFVIAESRPEP